MLIEDGLLAALPSLHHLSLLLRLALSAISSGHCSLASSLRQPFPLWEWTIFFLQISAPPDRLKGAMLGLR